MAIRLHRTQRQWLIGILLISLIAPILLATFLAAVGNIAGCQMVGDTAAICRVAGVNIGHSISLLVDWTFTFTSLILFRLPLLGMAILVGLLVLIYKSFRGWYRVLIGFFSVWYLGLGPPIAGILFVAYFASRAQCSLNEGGVGACYLFGLDVGKVFHLAAIIPWAVIILVPICAIASFVYAGITVGAVNQE